jgi:branched-chain amino acid transport system permease protein
MSNRSILFLVLALLVALALLPMAVGAGTLGALINVLIAALFALAFNLLVGQGGMMSFGHAA